MWGLTVEEASGPDFEVWPDNWQAVQLFSDLRTQWNAGGKGPTGLNYPAMESVMRITGVRPAERAELFRCIRVMEAEALDFIHKKT